MVYGAISEYGKRYYTDMSEVFSAIGTVQADYNWLITDFELNCRVDGLGRQDSDYWWLTGGELTMLLKKYPGLQWIWGVLSGVDKRIPKEEVLRHPLPYADGYEGFRKNPLSLQHPLAEIEIVPWDSTLVMVLAREREIVDRFRKNFLPNEDLLRYNEDLNQK